jgi:SAM-dependent methyltransferase
MDRSAFARMQQLEKRHWWFAARRRLIGVMINRFCRLSKAPRILEAGCGSGGNIEFLQGFAPVDAFEYDDQARTAAMEKSGLEIKSGCLPDTVPFADTQYDLIALFDVLEHVEQDRETLTALSGKLKPQGQILLTVPAMPWLWSKHDDLHHHFRRYTYASLLATAKDAGLEVSQAGYFNCFLFPAAVAQRQVKKLLKSDKPDDNMPPAALNAVLTRIFGSERHFLGRIGFPFGLSLYAVLRPKQGETPANQPGQSGQ